MMPRFFFVLASITAAMLGCAAVAGCKKQESARPGGSALLTVDVQPVTRQPLRETLFATGTLLAREAIVLQAERAGIVKEIRFEEGKPVRAGDVLLVIDDSELQAQLARARAQLELARTAEARDRRLFEAQTLSEADYEASRANLDVARAETELILAQLEKTRVVAPFDGMSGLRQVSPGAYLVPGTPIATLQDVRSLKLDFTVPERYLPWLQAGQKVNFRVAGQANVFEATIVAIEPAVTVETRSVRLRAVAPNTNGQLAPGAFAEVELALNEIPDAILIPPIALVAGLKQQTVFVHRDGKVMPREVQIGLRRPDAVQVVQGLQPGEELVTSGVLQLRPGMPVQARRDAAVNFKAIGSATNAPAVSNREARQ